MSKIFDAESTKYSQVLIVWTPNDRKQLCYYHCFMLVHPFHLNLYRSAVVQLGVQLSRVKSLQICRNHRLRCRQSVHINNDCNPRTLTRHLIPIPILAPFRHDANCYFLNVAHSVFDQAWAVDAYFSARRRQYSHRDVHYNHWLVYDYSRLWLRCLCWVWFHAR